MRCKIKYAFICTYPKNTRGLCEHSSKNILRWNQVSWIRMETQLRCLSHKQTSAFHFIHHAIITLLISTLQKTLHSGKYKKFQIQTILRTKSHFKLFEIDQVSSVLLLQYIHEPVFFPKVWLGPSDFLPELEISNHKFSLPTALKTSPLKVTLLSHEYNRAEWCSPVTCWKGLSIMCQI